MRRNELQAGRRWTLDGIALAATTEENTDDRGTSGLLQQAYAEAFIKSRLRPVAPQLALPQATAGGGSVPN